MKINVVDVKGANVQELELKDSVWNIEPHKQAIYDAVVAQQASLRQGTKKVKTRAEVRGGGRKPWKQKGTGRARQGSIRAPQWRGGGVAFGPTPDINYKKAINKKVKQLAIRSALSIKARENSLVVIDKFAFTKPSTKEMLGVLSAVKVADARRSLIVTKEVEELVNKSANNIEGVKSLNFQKMNVFDLLNATKLVVTLDAVNKIEEVYA
jgi:large subunit ribosomal protein L4